MKILLSEYKSDYSNYIFPYAVWAFPEGNERPSDLFARGFLPASLQLKRFYLCRQVRVKLDEFKQSSENRRIFRKCEHIRYRLVERNEFEFTSEWRDFCKNYADIKFGKDVMSYQRLDALFGSKIVSHLLIYEDEREGKDVGLVTLYREGNKLAFYYYAFYNLNYYRINLGMFMMTSAVDCFAESGVAYLYLGSCYSRNALYKTQFSGAEFYNGFRWSENLKELKYIIHRDSAVVNKHLLESDNFREQYYEGDLNEIVKEYGLKVV
jgi:arginyl-tRNA--protein-N-Asp/Glu arginylyltransferase